MGYGFRSIGSTDVYLHNMHYAKLFIKIISQKPTLLQVRLPRIHALIALRILCAS